MDLFQLNVFAGVFLVLLGIYYIVFWWSYWKVNYKGKLLTGGPYSLVRHPYYFGFLLLVTGIIVITPRVETVGLALLSWSIVISHIKGEEEQLIKKYGKQYRDYIEKVHWRLIPMIY